MKKKKHHTLIKFGDNIRDARNKLGLSQEKLAIECDLDRTYVGGVERGERNVSVLNICKIANALDVKPAALLKNL
ncbi:MAG: helix-turn-helix transcriptional regulator [PVC group bacterium]|nr:helix-turn-helix transcriptional regulator [PVC group bacterium]